MLFRHRNTFEYLYLKVGLDVGQKLRAHLFSPKSSGRPQHRDKYHLRSIVKNIKSANLVCTRSEGTSLNSFAQNTVTCVFPVTEAFLICCIY